MNSIIIYSCLPILLLFSSYSLAISCKPVGGVKDISYDLSSTLTKADNIAGRIITLKKQGRVGVMANCGNGTNQVGSTLRSYVTSLPEEPTKGGNFHYLKLNDFLAASMVITDDYAGSFYPPKNYVQMGQTYIYRPFPVSDSNLNLNIKILRPFVNTITIPPTTLFTVYVTTSSNDALSIPVYTISYRGTINVPQSCTLNAGDVISFDFKKVGSSLFRKAGAGARVSGIPAQTRPVTIACSNIDMSATLSLRLEAHNSASNTIISDNPDVGFTLANGANNSQLLTPNAPNSGIPFTLDASGKAIAQLSAWLTSVTGQEPKGGVASAQAFLRVDFP